MWGNPKLSQRAKSVEKNIEKLFDRFADHK